MKKNNIKRIKEIVITKEEYEVPQGWELIKEPTKMTENNNDFFKIVIGKSD